MIQRYERGKVHAEPPDKLWQLARFYRWTPDSIGRVLQGELPKYLPPPEISEVARERIAKAIAEHPTLPEDEKRDLFKLLLPNGA